MMIMMKSTVNNVNKLWYSLNLRNSNAGVGRN